MKTREEIYMEMALKYKKEFEATPWWNLSKRARLKKEWDTAAKLMVKFSK